MEAVAASVEEHCGRWLSFERPSGGFYLWVRLKKGLPSALVNVSPLPPPLVTATCCCHCRCCLLLAAWNFITSVLGRMRARRAGCCCAPAPCTTDVSAERSNGPDFAPNVADPGAFAGAADPLHDAAQGVEEEDEDSRFLRLCFSQPELSQLSDVGPR